MLTPEQKELQSKEIAFVEVQEKLANLELEYSTLQAELLSFRSVYTYQVVRRLYELDQVEAQIAQYLLSTDPNSVTYQQQFEEANKRVKEAEQAFDQEEHKEYQPDFKPSDELKKLYREVAKQIHPDLTTDENERERRSVLMAEVNDAYKAGNQKKIEQLMNDWHSAPENVTGEGVGADLVRLIRKMAQAERRLQVIQSEMDLLKSTEIYELLQKARIRELDGGDLLKEMAGYLDEKIKERKEYLVYIMRSGNNF